MDFEWQIALGENLLDVEEFLNLVSNMRGLVKVKDQFVYIKEEELVKLFEEFKAKPKLHSSQKLQILFSGEYNDAPVLFSEDLLKIIEEWKSSEEIKIPNSLKGNLREHQKRGFGWLYKNYKIGFGSILADDMGLGKTIQVITFLLKLKEEDQLKDGKIIIIAPTTLITNWSYELDKFAPKLSYHIYHGLQRDLKNFKEDIMLTSYGLARKSMLIQFNLIEMRVN